MSGFCGWMRIFEMCWVAVSPTCVHVAPAVGGLVHAVAGCDVLPRTRLAHADVDDRRVRERDVDRSDRGRLEEAVGNVAPVRAGIGGFPHAAMTGAEIEHQWVVRISCHGRGTAAARWPNEAPLRRVEEIRCDARVIGRSSARCARKAPLRGSTRVTHSRGGDQAPGGCYQHAVQNNLFRHRDILLSFRITVRATSRRAR